MVISSCGYGKRTPLTEYPAKRRATGGIKTINQNALSKIGLLTAARVVQEADDLTIISAGGVVLRTKVKNISRTGRATRGTHLMELQEGDTVASMARLTEI
jgi:DNA gyrase subunit A